MPSLLVAVADSVFPNLDLARAVVSRAGAELRMVFGKNIMDLDAAPRRNLAAHRD